MTEGHSASEGWGLPQDVSGAAGTYESAYAIDFGSCAGSSHRPCHEGIHPDGGKLVSSTDTARGGQMTGRISALSSRPCRPASCPSNHRHRPRRLPGHPAGPLTRERTTEVQVKEGDCRDPCESRVSSRLVRPLLDETPAPHLAVPHGSKSEVSGPTNFDLPFISDSTSRGLSARRNGLFRGLPVRLRPTRPTHDR